MLAACRGLHAGGFRVSAAGTSRLSAANLSRTVSRRYRVPDPRLDPQGFVTQLVDVLGRVEHALLMPGTEASLLRLSEQRARVEPLVRLGLPPHEIVVRALDKNEMLTVAERVGLGPPPSVVCAGEDDALAAASQLGYPVLLKPAHSLLDDELGVRQRTSRPVEEADALRRELPSFGLPVTVQRRVDGPVISFGGVAVAGGRLLGLCASRYIRTWPASGGSASCTETFEPAAADVERLEEFLRQAGWEGVFELEALLLPEGRLAAIDFNPRPYGSMTLAVGAGANLPALFADHVLGRGPEPQRARPGVTYRWEEAEIRNLFLSLRRGRLGEALALLHPRSRSVGAFFALSDPAPLLGPMIQVPLRLATRLRKGAGSA